MSHFKAPPRPRPRLVALAACVPAAALPALASAQDGGVDLAYRVPSPPTVVYELFDTLTTSVNTGGMNQTIDLTSQTTLRLDFAEDARGTRATGTVEAFSASMASPMGSQNLQPDVEGSYEWLLGPAGVSEVVAMPTAGGPAGQTTFLALLAHELFFALPGGAVETGDTWTDTIAWSDTQAIAEVENTIVFTYSLAGESVVDGRPMARVEIAGELTISGTVQLGGMAMEQDLAGTVSGVALWDLERGRIHSVELSREYSGNMNSPMGALPMRVAGTTVRRVGS